jgi:transposase
MLYVGLDVHSKMIAVCVLNEEGKVIAESCVRQVDQLTAMLKRLPDRFAACFEASTGYGWVHDMLRPLASQVVVAHPGHLRAIFRSKKKNDRNDARKLAKLLYLDVVPAVHVPPADVRAWRELITFRRKLVEKRTRAKNEIRALLRSVGVVRPRRPGLWSQAGVEWLSGLPFAQSLSAVKRDMLIQELQTLTLQIRRVEEELKRFSEGNPAVWQLRTIPGVGLRTAEAVVAFLDDPLRFPHSKRIGSYFGLVPQQDQSADKNRLGHITHEGSATVRHLLTEAVWQAVRRSPTVRAYFLRVQRDDVRRKKIAVVATAHYLARVMYAMLRNGTIWRENPMAA